MSSTFCMAVNGWALGVPGLPIGAVTFNGTTWSAPTSPVNLLEAEGDGLVQVSCTSPSWCMGLTYYGFASTWSAAQPIGQGLRAVSCTSATFCVAVGGTNVPGRAGNGRVVRFDGHSWTSTTLDPALNVSLAAVSCGSTSFCVAVGAQFFTVYNGKSWSTPQPVPGAAALTAVSCPSATFCLAVDDSGGAYIHLASGWRRTGSTGIQRVTAVSCVSSSFCMAVEHRDDGGNRAVQFDGTSWRTPVVVDARNAGEFNTVSCASASYCIAGDWAQGQAFGGGDVARYDGTHWVTPVRVDDSTFGVQSVSCPTVSFCMAVTYRGDAIQAGFGKLPHPLLIGSTSPAPSG